MNNASILETGRVHMLKPLALIDWFLTLVSSYTWKIHCTYHLSLGTCYLYLGLLCLVSSLNFMVYFIHALWNFFSRNTMLVDCFYKLSLDPTFENSMLSLHCDVSLKRYCEREFLFLVASKIMTYLH